MWESKTAAGLIIMACTIGLYANGCLIIILTKQPQYGRYVHFHTLAKAGTNFIALCVFVVAEVPNLFAEDNIYPEFVFRACGSMAGVSAIPGRVFQFFISFGTCFIAFFPLKPFPDVIFISSVILPSIVGVIVFSVRISSINCSYQFSAKAFAWFYYPSPCAQVVQKSIARMVQFQILSCCVFNLTTFSKLVYDAQSRTIVENSHIARRMRKTKWRLIQCVAQDIPFIIDASVYFNEADGHGIFINFVFNTFVWNLAHMIDGIIMLAMLNKTKTVVSSGASVIVSSVANRLKTNKKSKTLSKININNNNNSIFVKPATNRK